MCSEPPYFEDDKKQISVVPLSEVPTDAIAGGGAPGQGIQRGHCRILAGRKAATPDNRNFSDPVKPPGRLLPFPKPQAKQEH
jgi:hypothetical protein